jgi:hypothetical protein
MAMPTEDMLRFVPSAVEGLPGVTEAAVFPDRLELLSEGKWVVIRFREIARWYCGGRLYRPLAWLGLGVRGQPSVADRDWFHSQARRYFRFYTRPVIAVFMPEVPRDLGYGETMFRRLQNVIGLGGHSTCDLG